VSFLGFTTARFAPISRDAPTSNVLFAEATQIHRLHTSLARLEKPCHDQPP
jgi:hypothetical protein